MTTLLLLKFGAKEHIQSLYETGDIYMNFMSVHKKSDINVERFDNFEGALTNEYYTDGRLQLKLNENDEWRDFRVNAMRLNKFADTSLIYSYCLYSITEEDIREMGLFKVDSRMKDFGNSMLMIRNHVTFLNRIKTYLEDNNYEYEMNHVSYYDPRKNYDNLSLHDKHNSLKHQKEFRILVKAKNKLPLQFNTGSLMEDCEMYDSNVIDTMTLKL